MYLLQKNKSSSCSSIDLRVNQVLLEGTPVASSDGWNPQLHAFTIVR
jgi:hypothetical protein